jgi:hypothetical protein
MSLLVPIEYNHLVEDMAGRDETDQPALQDPWPFASRIIQDKEVSLKCSSRHDDGCDYHYAMSTFEYWPLGVRFEQIHKDYNLSFSLPHVILYISGVSIQKTG